MTDVTSEIGALRKVVVHAPGLEWDLVPCVPGALGSYLIEDIFVLKVAREEHELLRKILGLFVGITNVLEFEDLLEEVGSNESARRQLVAAVSALESLGTKTRDTLLSLSPKELARALVRGAVINEETQDNRSTYSNEFPPIPNLLFTRDLGAAIPGGFVVGHAAMPVRRRETLLMRYVLKSKHFAGTNILDVRDFANPIFWHDLRSKEPVSIEGGDVMAGAAVPDLGTTVTPSIKSFNNNMLAGSYPL